MFHVKHEAIGNLMSPDQAVECSAQDSGFKTEVVLRVRRRYGETALGSGVFFG